LVRLLRARPFPALLIPLLLASLLLPACALPHRHDPASVQPWGGSDYEAYAAGVRRFVAGRRGFVSDRRAEELDWNSPAQWRPEGRPKAGVLLIHGLGDSPFSFVDMGPRLASMGFLARALLLPGCGTKAEDQVGLRVDDWRRTVAEQAALLATEVDRVYLGGFSTGANLAIELAALDPSIEGLILFSPAVKTDAPLPFLTLWLADVVDWVIKPSKDPHGRSLARYDMIPTDAMAVWWLTSRTALGALEARPYPKPVVMILAERDSVVDVAFTVAGFDRWFPHPSSRLIWYGEPGPVAGASRREGAVLVKPAFVPEMRVSSFSHTGVLFSPDNPEYGPDGNQRNCHNGQGGRRAFERCLAEPEVWFSAWGHREPGRIHARLTFNPWFEWQAGVIEEALLGDSVSAESRP
jgi:alpha-beta hydrolase superfamily lysophospholipase